MKFLPESLFLVGAALIVFAVYLWSVQAAILIAGAFLIVIAYGMHRDKAKP